MCFSWGGGGGGGGWCFSSCLLLCSGTSCLLLCSGKNEYDVKIYFTLVSATIGSYDIKPT